MKQVKAKILSNQEITASRFKIRVEAPSICRLAKPGQFVMVKCSKGPEPFLRRPFSFHRIGKDYFELLYQVIGKGTKILSQRKKKELLDLIGPLGNGFSIDHRPKTKDPAFAKASAGRQRLLVGGGIGVAPLLELGRRLIVKSLPLTVLLGAKTKSHILCEKDFKNLGAKVYTATEDGSKGKRGLVTDLLENKLKTYNLRLTTVLYACGPRDMLKQVANIAKSNKIPCQVSLEEKMACGTGACLGCAVKTVVGFKMVCKDGPIFNAGDIIW